MNIPNQISVITTDDNSYRKTWSVVYEYAENKVEKQLASTNKRIYSSTGKYVASKFDNTPVTGLLIDNFGSYTISGKHPSGAIVVDPRGFKSFVDIYSIADIISTCTIINGVVQEEIVWVTEGVMGYPISITSERYKDLLDADISAKIPLKEKGFKSVITLEVGDIIKAPDDYHYIYLGDYEVEVTVTPSFKVSDTYIQRVKYEMPKELYDEFLNHDFDQYKSCHYWSNEETSVTKIGKLYMGIGKQFDHVSYKTVPLNYGDISISATINNGIVVGHYENSSQDIINKITDDKWDLITSHFVLTSKFCNDFSKNNSDKLDKYFNDKNESVRRYFVNYRDKGIIQPRFKSVIAKPKAFARKVKKLIKAAKEG